MTTRAAVLILACLVTPSLQQETCNITECVLPNCRCADDPDPPGQLSVAEIPQIIMVSMENNINFENINFYTPIFENLDNPNGCPIRGTFFIEDDGSDYNIIKSLYDLGHEIGINSFDGTAPKDSSGWISMLKGVLEKLTGSGIDAKDVLGVRAPELAIGGDDEFIGIGDSGLLYDSSCTSVTKSDPGTFIWPYTIDYVPVPECDNGMAPSKEFRGKWEVLIADLHDLSADKLPCAVPSGCRNITTNQDAFNLFFNAFEEHYNGNRTPFVMVVDPAWAKNPDLRAGTIEFLQYVRAAFNDDVWIVPISKALTWIQTPTPMANLTDFEPWKC